MIHFQRKPFKISLGQAYDPNSNAEKAEVEWFYEDLQDLLELTPEKDVLFIIEYWNAKVGSHEIPGVTDKFGLGIQNEARQKQTEFCQENVQVLANTLFQQHKRWLYIYEHHEMVNNKIRLIILFSAKDGEALYSQKKQDQELTMALIMVSLLQNSDLNWERRENYSAIQILPK